VPGLPKQGELGEVIGGEADLPVLVFDRLAEHRPRLAGTCAVPQAQSMLLQPGDFIRAVYRDGERLAELVNLAELESLHLESAVGELPAGRDILGGILLEHGGNWKRVISWTAPGGTSMVTP